MTASPPLPPRTRQWSDLVTTDFATLDLARAIAVLPLGATEQHGPHLPLSVDTDLARGMVDAAAAHLPADLPALFLPLQPIGYSPEHAAFAGTLTLGADTVIRLWTDIAESVAASGVNKLVLFNTHGGNVGLMDVVAREWRTRLGMLVYSVSWFNLPLTDADGADVMARFSPDEQRFGVHGGQAETAMMLALQPGRVRRSRARAFASTSQARAAAHRVLGNGRSAKLAWAAQDLNPEGAAGNAAAANAADGLALIDAAGRALAELLQEIDRLPPDTLRQR
ncbi:creatininase family protein [Ottowia sp.]|uniref:creatininase family protein n=1 Tax=Ottowia sp. TaxID=1898956 RepID=UPI002B9681A7|nr:creatininase family protein [Ottowia sp.]HOB65636.1 creatininase family protein [Ottowia sp.]HPZ56377.1 creatininase family protein [Ottowia sp.]HQD46914.1 creatininase family protein [Ottowia sp.]